MLYTYTSDESDTGTSVLFSLFISNINHVSGMSVESGCLTSAV